MESLRELADRLDEAAATLTGAGRGLAAASGSDRVPDAAGTGRFTETTGALTGQWSAATGARAREAVTAADRIADLAANLRLVAEGYTDTDDAARRRHAQEV
ncbi:hypothetical protein BDK92_4153 [Micromonospora pisi]|uniref:Excreted virulence factor EspC (Type VII ESX diderm) n=1 Tax=Micromonospora pisi TaxID=589240 RepID=A0A495JLB5_9ACTN|nr:hypothetical protein [Micromonospora pisi]RKR89796.1 hypothetical protein BDK92_4153 [Micromonospora pisi]